jgi:hypothetical protein
MYKGETKDRKKTDQTSIVWLNSGEIALDLTSSRQVKISSRRSKKRNTLLLIEELTGHRKKKRNRNSGDACKRARGVEKGAATLDGIFVSLFSFFLILG